MSAAYTIPRKRAGRGHLTRDIQRYAAPAKPFAGPDGTGDGFDHRHCETLPDRVEADPFVDLDSVLADLVGDGFDPRLRETLPDRVEVGTSVREGGGIDQPLTVTPHEVVDPKLIAAIQSLHREHRGLQNAVTGMTLRIKADERWAAAARVRSEGGVFDGKKFPKPNAQDVAVIKRMRPRYYAGRACVENLRRACQKELLTAAKMLPASEWVASVKGFGLPSFAAIVGEAGDLGRYDNPAKLWTRFSLHVIDGKASRRLKGDDSQRFVNRRRAEAHVVGDTLLRAGGPYADLYRTRKAYEVEKLAAAGIEVKPAARIRADQRDRFMSEGQVHKRALRYIEKRLLLELWRAWRRATVQLSPTP